MPTSTLAKKPAAGSVAFYVTQSRGKFEAKRYMPMVPNARLRFNAAGDLIADSKATIIFNYTADGAIALTSGMHTIAKTSAAAMTVAAPSNQDGERLVIISNTDFAHVITFTGATLLDGTTGANLTVTMTAFKGSAITVVAVGTKWLLESSSNVTSITV